MRSRRDVIRVIRNHGRIAAGGAMKLPGTCIGWGCLVLLSFQIGCAPVMSVGSVDRWAPAVETWRPAVHVPEVQPAGRFPAVECRAFLGPPIFLEEESKDEGIHKVDNQCKTEEPVVWRELRPVSR
jgi:hypothetical protein